MEAKQVQELEKLLDEYRAIISAKDATPRIDDEAHTKVCEEKEQLVKQVGELNQKIENLELQLEFVSSKVSGIFLNCVSSLTSPLYNS